MKEKKDIYKNTILKVFSSKPVNEKNRIDLVVIKWETGKTITLENRRMYYDVNFDEWRTSKQSGIGLEEFDLIIKNKDEIRNLLQSEVPKNGTN